MGKLKNYCGYCDIYKGFKIINDDGNFIATRLCKDNAHQFSVKTVRYIDKNYDIIIGKIDDFWKS